jgi:hypothetical protein
MRGATVRLAGRQDCARSTAKQRKTTHFESSPSSFTHIQIYVRHPSSNWMLFSSYRHVCFYFLIVSASREAGRSRPVGLEPLHKPKFDLPDKDILDPLGRFDSLVFLRF